MNVLKAIVRLSAVAAMIGLSACAGTGPGEYAPPTTVASKPVPVHIVDEELGIDMTVMEVAFDHRTDGEMTGATHVSRLGIVRDNKTKETNAAWHRDGRAEYFGRTAGNAVVERIAPVAVGGLIGKLPSFGGDCGGNGCGSSTPQAVAQVSVGVSSNSGASAGASSNQESACTTGNCGKKY